MKLRVLIDANGCWNWQGYRDKDGYGISSYRHRPMRAHRLTYIFAKGPIADGLEVDHLCRNKACCNPSHLEAVTYRENQRRGNTFIALNPMKTHCPQGHPYAGDNLFRDEARGWRGCNTCRRAAVARYQEKRRA